MKKKQDELKSLRRKNCLKNSILGAENGFTLAEVLITLVIIGVIGALTVPSLVQNTKKQEYVSALKKVYSTLSQVTNQIIAEEGSPKGDEGWGTIENVYDLFKKHLIDAKDCSFSKNCLGYSEIKHKRLDGSDDWQNNRFENAGGFRMVLNDGMIIHMEKYDKSCNIYNGAPIPYCGLIKADVNGIKKPNQWGRDIFWFELREDGLHPYGYDWPNGKHECIDSSGYSTGATCALNVLTEGAMNY